MSGSTVDDPRKLSVLMMRVADLALSHSVGSVVIGLGAAQGDQLFPDFVHFLRSALRVEDGIFSMTRERAVVHLADLNLGRGQAVFGRLLEDFVDEFPSTEDPAFQVNYFEVEPGQKELSVRNVLTEIFPARMLH